MTDFEESKNYDDLLAYRFGRFDIQLRNYLILATNNFFENFIESYLSYMNFGSSAKGFNSEMVEDYKATKKDLFEISTSGFGIFYFTVLDEVIINRMIQLGNYDFIDIKDIVDKIITRIYFLDSDFRFKAHELYKHDNLNNRLDHLNKLSIIQEINVYEIFEGSEISYDGPEISEIDTSVKHIQEGNIDSAILTHVILSWLWFACSKNYSNKRRALQKLNFEGEDRDKIDNTPRYVKLLVKFGIAYVVLYYSLLFLNIEDEFHWLLSIFLLIILYGVLTTKTKKSDSTGGIEILSESEKNVLFHEMQTILNCQSYHPESIKNKLNYIENKGLSIPQSMYSLIKKPLENNTLIYRSDNIKYIFKYDESNEPLSAKFNDLDSFKRGIYEMGEIILMRKEDKIEIKYSDSDITHELQEMAVMLNMTVKPKGIYWKVEKDWENENGHTESHNLNYKLENISIGFLGEEGWDSSLQGDSIFVIDKEKLVLPNNYIISIYKDSQFTNDLKSIYGVDIDEMTLLVEEEKEPLGRIYFNYFTDEETLKDYYKFAYTDHEMCTFIGLRDDIYEKVINQSSQGDIDYIRFDTICTGYSSSFKHGSARDLILDQSHISESFGMKHNTSKTVLKITDLSIKFSN
jgi:hypothetical protein